MAKSVGGRVISPIKPKTVVEQINWAKLRRQKRSLLAVMDGESRAGRLEDLDGLLSLIDSIQDEAAKSFGEEAVFGPSKD
jgi:hypothetical protein